MRMSLYSFLALALAACGGPKHDAKPANAKPAPVAHSSKTTTTAHKTTTRPKTSTAMKPKPSAPAPTKTASRTTTKRKTDVPPHDTTSSANPLMHGSP